MVDAAEVTQQETREGGSGAIPDLSGDIRHLVPELGLRNYWYPALAKKRIPKRHPIQVRMLGEELCFYRGAQGQPVAVRDVCPHRGARLSEGTCHWKGTVSCPYHGWTFDEQGKNVAVLSEGPDSKICGKPGTEAKLFPTRELKGVVFVWIGDTEPAPIEEDVPEEFFMPDAYILFNDHTYWRTHWCVSLENYFDSHANYLHRDDIQAVLSMPSLLARTNGERVRPFSTPNGLTFTGPRNEVAPVQDLYSNGRKWPKHRLRWWWAWLFVPIFSFTRVPAPKPKDKERWGHDLHLPGMTRVGREKGSNEMGFRFGGGGFLGKMTRQVVAVEPWLTHVWYFHYTRPGNPVRRMWHKLLYSLFYRWAGEYSFSAQDGSVMPNQLWDSREMLSPADFGVVQWRKLVITKHFGGRNAPFAPDRPS